MRFYRALLWLYPAGFRTEYGDELTAAFANRMRDHTGPLAPLMNVLAAIGEVALTGDDTPNPEDQDEGNEVVAGFLELFEQAQTIGEIKAISADIRLAGSTIANGRAALLEARDVAMKRVGK